MGKKDSETTTNTVAEPWSGVRQFLLGLYGQANQQGQIPQQYFPHQTYAPMNPLTQQGLQGSLGYASNVLPEMLTGGLQGIGSMMAAPDVANNPYVGQMIGQQVGAMTNAFGQTAGRYDTALQDQTEQLANLFGQTTGRYGTALQQQGDELAGLYGQNVGRYGEALQTQQEALQEAIGYQGDAIDRQLKNEWLPEVRSGFGLAGHSGSSRQGVAEGQAIGDATRALSQYGTSANQSLAQLARAQALGLSDMGSTAQRTMGQLAGNQALGLAELGGNQALSSGQLARSQALGLGDYASNAQQALGQSIAGTQLGAYGQGLDAQKAGLAMLPSMAQLGMLPSQIYQQAGSAYQGEAQRAIDDARARFEYEQMEPWQRMQMLANLYNGANEFGTTTATATEPNNTGANAAMGAIMGGLTYGPVGIPLGLLMGLA